MGRLGLGDGSSQSLCLLSARADVQMRRTTLDNQPSKQSQPKGGTRKLTSRRPAPLAGLLQARAQYTALVGRRDGGRAKTCCTGREMPRHATEGASAYACRCHRACMPRSFASSDRAAALDRETRGEFGRAMGSCGARPLKRAAGACLLARAGPLPAHFPLRRGPSCGRRRRVGEDTARPTQSRTQIRYTNKFRLCSMHHNTGATGLRAGGRPAIARLFAGHRSARSQRGSRSQHGTGGLLRRRSCRTNEACRAPGLSPLTREGSQLDASSMRRKRGPHNLCSDASIVADGTAARTACNGQTAHPVATAVLCSPSRSRRATNS